VKKEKLNMPELKNPAVMKRDLDVDEAQVKSDTIVAATLYLKDLDDAERAFLAICQRIFRRHSGCASPFEDFFVGLVASVECNYWPTPGGVAHELETFRRDFDDMSVWARRFVEAYPERHSAQQMEAAHV